MIKIAGSVAKGWLAGELGVAFDRDYYLDPIRRRAIDQQCHEHVRQRLGDLGLFHTESNLGRIEFYEPDQVIVGGIQPNLIVGMLLGAEFLPVKDADADIAGNCLDGVDLARLPAAESLLSHGLIQQFDEQIRAIRQCPAANLRPIPPFFWDASGRAAVHGAMTSGLKFRGAGFFVDMITDPDRCRYLIDWLTEVSIVLVTHYGRLADLAIRGIHVGECAACMVDASNFRKYVVPATSRLGEALGPVRFHSCGRSDHVIRACREIARLESLDVGGETSVARIRALFGRAFPVSIAPLVEDMSVDSPRAILAWFDRLVRENDGGNLTIGYHLETHYHLATIRALHEAVARANA